MRVVIADDEKFVLVVLKSALRSVRFPIEIVGEALDGDDAYRLCCKKKPDLLIMRNYFWQQPGDREFVTGTLERLCVNPMQEKVSDLLAMEVAAAHDLVLPARPDS